MRIPLRSLAVPLTAFLLVSCASEADDDEADEAAEPAAAEGSAADASLARYAGEWDATAIMESGDTVEFHMTTTADRSGWTTLLPDREVMQVRVLSAQGDSVVTETGPFESILREGVQVTVRQVMRMQGDRLVGTMRATYAGGEGDSVVAGRVEASRSN